MFSTIASAGLSKIQCIKLEHSGNFWQGQATYCCPKEGTISWPWDNEAQAKEMDLGGRSTLWIKLNFNLDVKVFERT